MNDFLLPDVGEGLTEAELVSWKVTVGDTVKVNDVLCEIGTAKSLVELPSPYAGVVSELLIPEGVTVPVGTPIIRIGADVPAEPPSPDLPNVRKVDEPYERLVDPPEPPSTEAPMTLVGSGPKEGRKSRIMLRGPRPRTEHPLPGVSHTTVEPIRGVRKAMAEAMTTSAAIPQVTIWTTTDATRTIELAARLDVRLMTVVSKIVLLALTRHPMLNSTFTEEGVVLHDHVNLGIAAATPRGLIVPNIREADGLDLQSLQAALDDVIATARAGRTQPAAQIGGTFTITNIGPFGIEGGTPLLNPGESGILCLGAVTKRPWVVEDRVVPRDVVTLSLTFDHRHIDGEAGSRFLRDVAALIDEPGSALTF